MLGWGEWDMSMLLHDARRDVSAEREQASLARYFVLRPDIDREAFLADYNALGALNIARILGIFSRLVHEDQRGARRRVQPLVGARRGVAGQREPRRLRQAVAGQERGFQRLTP